MTLADMNIRRNNNRQISHIPLLKVDELISFACDVVFTAILYEHDPSHIHT